MSNGGGPVGVGPNATAARTAAAFTAGGSRRSGRPSRTSSHTGVDPAAVTSPVGVANRAAGGSGFSKTNGGGMGRSAARQNASTIARRSGGSNPCVPGATVNDTSPGRPAASASLFSRPNASRAPRTSKKSARFASTATVPRRASPATRPSPSSVGTRKLWWSSPRARARGGHCSASAGISLRRFRAKVETKQLGAAAVTRSSQALTRQVIVPPPLFPVTPRNGAVDTSARPSSRSIPRTPSHARHVPNHSPVGRIRRSS